MGYTLRLIYYWFLGVTLQVGLSALSFFRTSKKDTASITHAGIAIKKTSRDARLLI